MGTVGHAYRLGPDLTYFAPGLYGPGWAFPLPQYYHSQDGILPLKLNLRPVCMLVGRGSEILGAVQLGQLEAWIPRRPLTLRSAWAEFYRISESQIWT